MSGFPKPPPQEYLQRLQLLHKYMRKVVKLSGLAENEIMRKLFGLSVSWLHEQKNLDPWKVPVNKLLVFAQHHIRRNTQRVHNNRERHYRWGREYSIYFNKYLEQGFCIRTSHGKARKDFIANHPLNEELADSEIPGHSRPALKRYHDVYLVNSRSREDNDYEENGKQPKKLSIGAQKAIGNDIGVCKA